MLSFHQLPVFVIFSLTPIKQIVFLLHVIPPISPIVIFEIVQDIKKKFDSPIWGNALQDTRISLCYCKWFFFICFNASCHLFRVFLTVHPPSYRRLPFLGWWIVFWGMVHRRKALSLIPTWGLCRRFTPYQISDTPSAGFDSVQNLNLGFAG